MSKKTAKVLLVEDIKIAQKVTSFTLESLNCDVDIAENGSKALELAETNHYDIILMDLGLPDVDGMTVTETIRKMPHYDQNTPIVALTAHADEDYRKNCLEIGMSGYMIKPLTTESAKDLLDNYLRH
jgi:two-component system, OmpR family, aerobic respiration control sensor histidine kinase ArcB